MRLAVYGGVSSFLATCSVLAAFRQRANFYAASVYLSKSNACMMILCNFGIFCTVMLSKLLQSVFFGKLRSIEVERLHDRLWFTVTETLLALAMFRDEFDTTFVVLFISLIFVKCFHWLASDRVEWMDQSPTPPGRLFHARMISVLFLVWITDLLLIAYATESVLLHGPSVVLMFEMEYIIMQVTCLSIICKYFLNSYGQYRAREHWEEKSTYLFYIELATDFLKLLTYVGFLSLTLTFYGLPINVLRDVYYTARSFISKCNNLVRFRQATRNMNERYPNATHEEMSGLADKTCIICREDMEFRENSARQPAQSQADSSATTAAAGPNDTPKKLPCGHIFHFHCLRSWLERQQTCPTCRRPVLQANTTPSRTPDMPAAAPAAAGGAGLVGQAPAAGGAGFLAQAPAAGGAGFLAQAPAAGGVGLLAQTPPTATSPADAAAPHGTHAGGTTAALVQHRMEIQQRLREFQQRLASISTGTGLAATASSSTPRPVAGTSSAPESTSHPYINPLASFSVASSSLTTIRQAPLAWAEPSAQSAAPQLSSLLPNNSAFLSMPPKTSACQGHSSRQNEENKGQGSSRADQPSMDESAHSGVTSPKAATSEPTDSLSSSPPEQRTEENPLVLDHPRLLDTGSPRIPLPQLLNQLSGKDSALANLSVATQVTSDQPVTTTSHNAPTPSLADVDVPYLIPLFDTETYRVPEALRNAMGSKKLNPQGGCSIDSTAVRLPSRRFDPPEYEGLIHNCVEEQLKVLLSVQETLVSCSNQLKRALNIKDVAKGKGKARASEHDDNL